MVSISSKPSKGRRATIYPGDKVLTRVAPHEYRRLVSSSSDRPASGITTTDTAPEESASERVIGEFLMDISGITDSCQPNLIRRYCEMFDFHFDSNGSPAHFFISTVMARPFISISLHYPLPALTNHHLPPLPGYSTTGPKDRRKMYFAERNIKKRAMQPPLLCPLYPIRDGLGNVKTGPS
jgi:hypothetical protein